MKTVTTEELINYKILPYNIYSEYGEKLFAAGEVLTPGKLLQLRHLNLLYRDDEETTSKPKSEEEKQQSSVQKSSHSKGEMVIEQFEMNPKQISSNKLSVDDIDVLNYKGPINKSAKIDPVVQVKIKAFYSKILDMIEDKPPIESLGMFANVRDKIVQDIIFGPDDVIKSSQIKLLGEYKKCHALNTAILAGTIAKKMNLDESDIMDVVLGALLHDIGKTRIDESVLGKLNLTMNEQKLIQTHTQVGYRMLKYEMDLPESVCKIALQHHEANDGSGYPHRLSGNQISRGAQIVSVSNFFDNLSFNRTVHKVKNTKDALRVMLEKGTKIFAADVLYSFIHMFSYNDTVNFEEMVL